jgi:hypothetical protein
MSTVTILEIALGCVLAVAVPWRIYQQRADFPSKDRYAAWVGGLLLLLVMCGLAEAHLRLGYPGLLLPIVSAAAGCMGAGLMLWGSRGYKPKSN